MSDLGLYDGCHVLLANGETVGPLNYREEECYEPQYPWTANGISWTKDGRYFLTKKDRRDIVSVIPATSAESAEVDLSEGISERILAAAREAGLKARPAYDEFVVAIVGAAFAHAESHLPLMVLKNPERTGKCMFEEGELLDAISVGFQDGKQFTNRSDIQQGIIRRVAANVMRLVEGSQNESENRIRPSERTEGGQSDPLFRGLDKLHPATRAFLQAIYPEAPLRAVESPSECVLLVDYGRPGQNVAHIRLSIDEGVGLGEYPKIPLWIEEDGTYRPGAHPAAVEAMIEGER